MRHSLQRPQRGQALALFTIAIAAITLGAAVVVDGGYGFAMRRNAQNAADFAAMAGTRIVGISLTGHPAGTGTASNVESAVRAALTSNDATLVSAQYVDEAGALKGNVVGATIIPDARPSPACARPSPTTRASPARATAVGRVTRSRSESPAKFSSSARTPNMR